ncbi:aldose 1-epimerase family protein [Micrococcales bacterium 31B]|nr:aldose 1-epimerase family protein [Micrococcales bacterium 31B]
MNAQLPHTSQGATGTQYHLYGHGYSAIIVQQGAGVRSLEFEGRALIVGYAEDEPMPAYRGALVAPWPNRLADGKYSYQDVEYTVPITEPGRRTALHGLVCFENFECVQHSGTDVTLRRYLADPKGYPFDVYLTVTYSLKADGLHTTVAARNMGALDAPFGVCPHPYLVAGDSPLNEWVFSLPASRVLYTTERLLPQELVSVFDDASFDFQPDANGAAREIGTKFLDHAYTGLNWEANGRTRASVWDPAHRTGTEMEWDRECRWVQVHTADTDDPSTTRLGLAVEPMTCPPDAFNSGEDLIILHENNERDVWWRIGALTDRSARD